MKVAVITPYFDEPDDYLRTCHDSVAAQTHPCTHFMVADGRPSEMVESWRLRHVRIPVGCADYGDTPRGVGSVLAIGQGFDAIAYLDADNWYCPEHIATLAALHKETGAAVITAARNLHRLDGSLLGYCDESDGKKFVDTNCYFMTRAAFSIIPVWWMMEPSLHVLDDRVVLLAIRRAGLSHVHSPLPTVAYRTAFTFHYERFGETPPPGTKTGTEILAALERIKRLQDAALAANGKS